LVRRHLTLLRLTLMAADAVAAMAVFVAVSIFRFGPSWPSAWVQADIPAPVAMGSWAALWVLVMWFLGLYRLRAHWSAWAETLVIVRATALVGIIVFVLLFGAQLPDVSRLFLVGLFGAQLVVTLASRLAIRLLFAAARTRGLMTRNVLVIGTSPSAEAFADLTESHRELGLRVIGHLGRGGSPGDPLPRRPVLGRFEDIEEVLHSSVVDEVAICVPVSDWELVEAITRICAEEGKVVRVPSDDAVPGLAGAYVEQYGGLTIQSLIYGPDRILSLLAKRTIDVVGAILLLLITSPLLVGISLAIRAFDGPPVFFRQSRVGLHGRTFEVFKFRTMARDAEDQLADLMHRNEIAGHAFKVTNDPRVSRIGGFLRRTSLDELPQLLNVLRGEMSLVGPRPPLPTEVANYDVWHRRRFAMKPGITGLWQVSERRSPDFDRWVSIDLDYIDRWSLWLDLKIMARTIPAMLEGR
jgi:exopolysaccharide biosynthesis polyprenyl glycosylphosphotransferase